MEKNELKYLASQLAIGALMCLFLIAACSIGELLNKAF